MVKKNPLEYICIGRETKTTPASSKFHNTVQPFQPQVLRLNSAHNSHESLPNPRPETTEHSLPGLGEEKGHSNRSHWQYLPRSNTGPLSKKITESRIQQ